MVNAELLRYFASSIVTAAGFKIEEGMINFPGASSRNITSSTTKDAFFWLSCSQKTVKKKNRVALGGLYPGAILAENSGGNQPPWKPKLARGGGGPRPSTNSNPRRPSNIQNHGR